MRWLVSEPQNGSSDKRSSVCLLKSQQKVQEHSVRSINVFISCACCSHQIVASSAVRALLALPQYKSAKRLSVYLSMPSGEIATTEIVYDALKSGKQLFVPYTYQLSKKIDGQPSSIMDMLEVRSIDDVGDFEADKWGIPVPGEDSINERANSFGGIGKSEGKGMHASQRAGLDLIVLPGMAFDRNLGRLGHGKGYYDHFLDRCQGQSEQEQTKMPFLGKTTSLLIHI
jgi:5-formyltetrahydrofolate cyclo-ligase